MSSTTAYVASAPTSRPSSRTRRREFYEDTPPPAVSNTTSASRSERDGPVAYPRDRIHTTPRNPIVNEASPFATREPPLGLSSASAWRASSGTAIPILSHAERQRAADRRNMLADLTQTAAGMHCPPQRHRPVPLTRPLLPFSRIASGPRRDNAEAPSLGCLAKPLSALVGESGRRAMEDDVLHWRSRCGWLEAQLLATVKQLDTAQHALAAAVAPSQPPHADFNNKSDVHNGNNNSTMDAAVVADAQHWSAIANAFLAKQSTLVTPRPTAADATKTTRPPAATSPSSPEGLERAPASCASPSQERDLAGRSLSPQTPSNNAYERLLSASPEASVPALSALTTLAPPPPLTHHQRETVAPTLEHTCQDSDAAEAQGEAPRPNAASSSCSSASPSPDSQELVYDVDKAAALTAMEKQRAQDALDAIRRSQPALAPSNTAPSAAAASVRPSRESHEDAREALARAEADLTALRMERDDLETRLVSTQEQLMRLKEEAELTTSLAPPSSSSSPSPLFTTAEDATALVRRLREAVHVVAEDSGSTQGDEPVTLDANGFPSWQAIVTHVEDLVEALDTFRVQSLELREELHVVREDRNELVGQQSDQVRRLQERLLQREQENVRLSDMLQQRTDELATLRAENDAVVAKLRASSVEATTTHIDALTSELAQTKHALQVKETALRIALRESIHASLSPAPSKDAPSPAHSDGGGLGHDVAEGSSPLSPAPRLPSSQSRVVEADTLPQAASVLLAQPILDNSRHAASVPPSRTTSWSLLRERSSPNVPAASSWSTRAASLGGGSSKRTTALSTLLLDPMPITARTPSTGSSARRGDGEQGRSGASSTTKERIRRTIQAANEDVMARHRELWREQEAQYGTENTRDWYSDPARSPY